MKKLVIVWYETNLSELNKCSPLDLKKQTSKDAADTIFKLQPRKMVKHTQTIRQQIADELFECVWPFCGFGA